MKGHPAASSSKWRTRKSCWITTTCSSCSYKLAHMADGMSGSLQLHHQFNYSSHHSPPWDCSGPSFPPHYCLVVGEHYLYHNLPRAPLGEQTRSFLLPIIKYYYPSDFLAVQGVDTHKQRILPNTARSTNTSQCAGRRTAPRSEIYQVCI